MGSRIRFSVGMFSLLFSVFSAGCVFSGKSAEKPGGIRLEHIALNVEDPVVVADWYCEHLEMKIQRSFGAPMNTRFVSDKGGNMMFEFFHNTKAPVPDYFKTDPGSLHIAFVVDSIEPLYEYLQQSGATAVAAPERLSTGDVICMLRDPWGVPIQFINRYRPMLDGKSGKN